MHHVRRQRWQITTGDTGTAFAVRSALRQRLDELNGGIARGLDEVAPGTAYVHLPKLHVHLKVRDLDELAELLPTALAHAVRDELHDNPAVVGTVRSSAIHRDDALRRYLASGSLPWPLRSLDTTEVLDLLRAAAAEWISQGGWNAVHQEASTSIATAFAWFVRLLPLLDNEAQTKLLQAAIDQVTRANDSHHVRLALIGLLETLAARNTGVADARHAVAFQLAISTASESDPPALIEAFLVCVENVFDAATASGLLQQLARIYRGMADIIPPALRSRFSASGAILSPHRTSTSSVRTVSGSSDEKQGPIKDAASEIFSIPQTPEMRRAPLEEDDAAPGLRVHSAGLVLLHGYLPYLFNACNIDVDADLARIAPASLRKAAAMLHWLACGRDDIHEFELGAIKTLLGCHPNDPVLVTEGLLDDADKTECTALLEAAVGHWPALGSTSADGLRISFLQRHGALTDKGGHWQLVLESESFDVLLAQLPWSISLIKLPWMTKPIFTDWPTR